MTIPFLAPERINLPEDHEELALKNDIQPLSSRILFHSGNDADRIVLLAGIPIMLLSIILAVFVFKFAKELYGVNAGLFALFLYAFSPAVLSLAGAVTTDMASAVFIFLAVYFYWRMLRKTTKQRVALAGLFFAAAISTRFVAFILVPVFAILGISYYYESKKKLKMKKLAAGFIAIMFIGYLFMNAVYGFNGTFTPLGKSLKDDPGLYIDKARYNSGELSRLAPEPLQGIARFTMDKIPAMLPYPLLKDMFSIPAISFGATSMFYVLGKFSTGVWYYYPLTLLIKLHLLILAAFAASLVFFRKTRAAITDELALILPFLSIILFFMFLIRIENGIRYVLPALPFLFVFVSKAVKVRSRIAAAVLLLLSISYVISSLTIFPHYSAYYNELAGGPENGYKIIPGANSELGGENMIHLRNYMEKKGIDRIKLSYGGFSEPDYYGINREDLPSIYQNVKTNNTNCGPTTGIVVVSSSNLVGLHMPNTSCFSWLQDYEAIDKIGYSLFVYNITQ